MAESGLPQGKSFATFDFAAVPTIRKAATLAKLDRFDCLVLDDLRYGRKDQAETTVLFELIAERYERKSLITTCNQPFRARKPWRRSTASSTMPPCSELNTESYRRRAALRKSAKAEAG